MSYILKDNNYQGSVGTLVQGTHRHKFFHRPLIPVLESVSPDVVMSIPEEQINAAKIAGEEQEEEPLAKTVEIQTDYRESGTQTDPFTPDYVIERGQTPEVLTIAHLNYGRGLPASMAEMELIEQMREKRAFEHALPPTSDEACFSLRRKLMEEQEFREWGKREDDIKRLQNERLNLLQSALVEREKESEDNHARRIEDIRLKKTEDKEKAIAKIQRKRIKVLRKMFKARKNLDNKGSKRDIIQEYSNFGSIVYAPITRDGLSLDKIASKYEVQPDALSTYQGVTELSESLPAKLMKSKVDIEAIKGVFKKSITRNQRKHKGALSKMQSSIDKNNFEKDEEDNKKKDTEQKKKYKNEFVRPDTPERPGRRTVANASQYYEEFKAALLLERLIRGRAEQNMMFEGKEKRLDLIAELRITEEWRQASDQQEERNIIQNYQERVLDGVAEGLQAEIIASTMEGLSKELVRFKQERKIAAMVHMAEQDRRRREAEEGGRRQAEQILGAREDNLFKEVMSVHQGRVDNYLQNIITNAIDDASTKQAYDEAQLKVKRLNKLLDKMEHKKNKPQSIVKDLMSSFLIPDIQRRKIQRQVQFEQKRFMESARKAIQSSISQAGQKLEKENVLKYDPSNREK
ncbi:unnamed protein product [Moneuplotes crassus]|uniref:Cilia- and flagella-associated protein 91 n=1 Tax=Euplotes crassus TaxID=5936 RepID=A0AAD1U3R6_EUPCR|nr:unnamed protein product [Moneuplotes crassus]